MVNSVIQHDPLVQSDTVEHFAYRALQAGINTFLSDANVNPNQLTCNALSAPGGQCTPTDFGRWKQVGDTGGSQIVPEYYAWGNPKFCFTYSCPTPTRSARTRPVLYVKETMYGAAGFPGHIDYEQSTVNLLPVNGFLTRIWWSTYEATDPQILGQTPQCPSATTTGTTTPTRAPTPAGRRCATRWSSPAGHTSTGPYSPTTRCTSQVTRPWAR